jgi:hypothetical protein
MRDPRTHSAMPADSRQDDPTPTERSLRARLAAHAMHARHDARQTTMNGRAAFLARFEREVDPESALDPKERQRRAEHARRVYFARLQLAAAKARRAKQARRRRGSGAA